MWSYRGIWITLILSRLISSKPACELVCTVCCITSSRGPLRELCEAERLRPGQAVSRPARLLYRQAAPWLLWQHGHWSAGEAEDKQGVCNTSMHSNNNDWCLLLSRDRERNFHLFLLEVSLLDFVRLYWFETNSFCADDFFLNLF